MYTSQVSLRILTTLVLLIIILYSVEHSPVHAGFLFLACLPYRPVPDCARLSGKIPQAERGRFLRKSAGARPCSILTGTGRSLQAEIKKRSVGYYSLSPSSFGIRCFKSGSLAMRSISSSIICSTSAFICE